MATVVERRAQLIARLFPRGVPRLWCPTLTHFSAPACPDILRIEKHFASLSPFVKGILVPGSTGEGWEMTDRDILGLLPPVLDLAARFDIKVLIGVLKTEIPAMLQCIEQLGPLSAHASCVGFTVCPPKGANLSSAEIMNGLAQILRLGHPTALYQLPQVTENEMTADVVSTLANEFANFYLFKDTSGADRVALSGLGSNVFMVRGSEKNGYASWLRETGGRYDGFLLSTANVLARQLAEIIRLVASGDRTDAFQLSDRISSLVSQGFQLVQDYSVGNAFTNTNKLLDHHMAYGHRSAKFLPPMLYSGQRLPQSLLDRASELLKEFQLDVAKGYIE